MCHTIVKIEIESSVMAQVPITRDQSVEDGRMVRVDGAGVEAEGEGGGMRQSIPRIQDGRGIGLAADHQNMRVIRLSEVDGIVRPIPGGDRAP